MKIYEIVMMTPAKREVIVADTQAAHNEATKMVAAAEQAGTRIIIQSIEYKGEVQTDPLPFDTE